MDTQLRFIAVIALGVLLNAFVPRAVAAGPWVNVTGNLANMPSECGNMSFVSAMPGTDRVIAGVALRGLWVNTSGSSWTHMGDGAGSDTITNRPSWIVYDIANPSVFWESGIYSGGGVFKTTDSGATFRRLGSIAHNDFVSVDMNDASRRTLIAGGHEQSQTVYKSTDGGQTWTNIGANLPPNTKFSGYPLLIDAQTFVVNAQGWGGGNAGIFRTTNGGTTWVQVSATGPSAAPLVTSTGAIYWPANGGLLKSTDAGNTWTQVGSSLRAITPVELPDGRLAAIGGTSLVTSADGGSTWASLGDPLPYSPFGLTYSPERQAFFIWNQDCGGSVPANAVMRQDFATGTRPTAPTGLRIVSDGF